VYNTAIMNNDPHSASTSTSGIKFILSELWVSKRSQLLNLTSKRSDYKIYVSSAEDWTLTID